jgi:hypothetical protein
MNHSAELEVVTTFSRQEDFDAMSIYLSYVEANQEWQKEQDKQHCKEMSTDQDLNNNNDDSMVDLMENQDSLTSCDDHLTIANKAKEDDALVILRSNSPTQARDFKLFCEICRRCFTSKKRLENHVVKCIKRTKNRNLFSCKKCCKFFKKRSGLVKHSIKYHDESLKVVETKNREDSLAKESIFHSATLLAVSDTLT